MTPLNGKFQNLEYVPHTFSCSYLFKDINIFNFLPSKRRPMSQSAIFAITSFNSICQNLHMFPTRFFRYLLPFQKYNNFKMLTFKNRSWSRSTIHAETLFDGKCQNLQMFSTHFCASSYLFRNIKISLLSSKSRSRS